MNGGPIKILISGPVGAGKSTFVKTTSETEIVSTDEISTEPLEKVYTTVAMDYGTVHLGDQVLYLFGTPGQDRFNFMWEILCDGAVGMILLVAGDKPKDFVPARKILEFITSQIPVPFVVGVTRTDSDRSWTPEDIAEFFQLDSHLSMSVDARRKEDCLSMLIRLFEVIEKQKALQQMT